jgi:hypothetical protein
MDAFEQLVSEILWMDGYWVRTFSTISNSLSAMPLD